MVADGKERDPANDLGNPGRSLGTGSPGNFGNGPSQGYGAQARPPQENPGRNNIPDAHWVPLESPPTGNGRRQHHPSDIPTLGGAWGTGAHLVGIDQGLRGAGLCGLGMAGCGLRHGQGPFGGDSVGPNPTDRGKAGSKRSILVDASGGPLSVVVAGANVHDTRLQAMTLESIVVERPDSGGDGIQHLCLDKGYDNPTGRYGAPVPRHIRRIGEEKLDPWGVKRYPARRWVVERPGFVIQVPGHPGALRQEGVQLYGPDPIGTRPAVVPPTIPTQALR